MKLNFPAHEDQTPMFACNGCRDEYSRDAEELRVNSDGETWCEDCFLYDHTWDEWKALKIFVPAYKREIARLRQVKGSCYEIALEQEKIITRLRAALELCRSKFINVRSQTGEGHTMNVCDEGLGICEEVRV
jgi:hypothetical protein